MTGANAEQPDHPAASDFLAGFPVAVDPVAIERELAALWKPAAEKEGGGGAVTRSCLANLIVLLPRQELWARASGLLADLARVHPSRRLVFQVESSTPEETGGTRGAQAAPRLRAFLSAECSLAGDGSAPVCSESITLRARRAEAALLRGAVMPLLVPDIPVVLWWNRGAGSDLVAALAGEVDRLVVDSGAEFLGASPLRELAAVVAQAPGAEVVDLGWGGLGYWRRALAEAFDDAVLRASLPEIVRVDLVCEERGHRATPAEALLLGGWILVALGWELGTSVCEPSGGQLVACRDARGRERTLAFSRRAPPTAAPAPASWGAPAAVVFAGESSRGATRLELELGSEPGTVRALHQGPRGCFLPRVLSAPFRSSVERLYRSLSDRADTTRYRRVLATAAALEARWEDGAGATA